MIERIGEAIWKSRAEILASATGILGWVLITAAVAELLPDRVVWLASAGLFCLSLFGFGFMFEIGKRGLYALSRSKR